MEAVPPQCRGRSAWPGQWVTNFSRESDWNDSCHPVNKFSCSLKEETPSMYVNTRTFREMVGLGCSIWRYFWSLRRGFIMAESAMLAVPPNASPVIICRKDEKQLLCQTKLSPETTLIKRLSINIYANWLSANVAPTLNLNPSISNSAKIWSRFYQGKKRPVFPNDHQQ